MGFSCLQVVLYHLGRGLEGFFGSFRPFSGIKWKIFLRYSQKSIYTREENLSSEEDGGGKSLRNSGIFWESLEKMKRIY